MSEETYTCVNCGKETDIIEIIKKALEDHEINEPEEISNRETLRRIWKCPSCGGELKVVASSIGL